MTKIGSNWGHEDRMARNTTDKGEQTCHMSLLIKDHKQWSPQSETVVPSRPVISGNTGLNCHLSELISHLIEPTAYEHSGNEINSTDDMLSKIENLNKKLSSKICRGNEFDRFVDLKESEKSRVDPVEVVEVPLAKNTHSKGDIRCFGVSGKRTIESEKQVKAKLKKRVEMLKNKRSGFSILPALSDRLEASFVLDSINKGLPIKLPGSRIKPRPKGSLQKDGISIVEADVKSLFPSLDDVETARLAGKAILESPIDFANWDLQKALRYLFIVGGKEFMIRKGLRRLIPRWVGDRADLITVGGSKPREDKWWKDSTKEIFEKEKRGIIAAVIEIAVHVVFTTHVYTFCGKFFLQQRGGPIGLRSTASLAALVMKIWDTLFTTSSLLFTQQFGLMRSLAKFSIVSMRSPRAQIGYCREKLPSLRCKSELALFKRQLGALRTVRQSYNSVRSK